MEHERRMKAKLAVGWCYGPDTSKDQLTHEALLPWGELPEYQKDKGRVLVRAIPRILAEVGYTVMKLHEQSGSG